MKTYKIETEDRYGRYNEYELEAESLELATATANERVNLPNGAFVMDVKEVTKSSSYEEAYGYDYEITSQEYYEPNPYDGTYSEM